MTDALRIYHHWIDVEKDYNDTKSIMMIAYIVGILISAGVTLWMFDRFSKKQDALMKKRQEQAEEDELREFLENEKEKQKKEVVDQRVLDKMLRIQVQDILEEQKQKGLHKLKLN